MYKMWDFLANYSALLILGALIALVWANLYPDSYYHFQHFVLIEDFFIGHKHYLKNGEMVYDLTLHYLVNDVLMAFFFFVAAKEVWEAVILKNGALRGKRAAVPLFATAGGILGPISVYLGIAYIMGSETYDAVANGWAIPTATDIAFSYLVGRMIFGAGHPAIRFLLLLAIADDAVGLIILAIFYPADTLAPEWLLLSLGAAVCAYMFFNVLPKRLDRGRKNKPISTLFRMKLSFWPFLIAGMLSWYGFFQAGIHTALGLLPIVMVIPHADREFGIFAQAEQNLKDLLNHIEHLLEYPVEIILFLFGLLNAGVNFSAIGEATWLVLAGLLIGKPAGVLLLGALAVGPFKLGLPQGMKIFDMLVVGMISAIGFTVSLFIAGVAFEAGTVQDAARMGAVLSFLAVPLSFLVARIIRIKKIHQK